MLKLGFHRLWVEMTKSMINSVSFSVMFNGQKLDSFKPSRGIRQGDQISPYLFLLVAEGLSCLLKSKNSVIRSHGYNGGSIGSDVESSTLCG